jgi:hypothetical protein
VARGSFTSGSKFFARAGLLAALGLAGCQSPQTLRLAPLNPELERVPGSGARYLVLVNTSGQDMHHCSFAAFLSDEHDANPLLRLQPYARCAGSKTVWRPGEEARFQCHDSPTMEFPIVQPLSHIEVVGHCDEGSFRQSWRLTESDNEVRPPGIKAQFSSVPGMQAQTGFALKP